MNPFDQFSFFDLNPRIFNSNSLFFSFLRYREMASASTSLDTAFIPILKISLRLEPELIASLIS